MHGASVAVVGRLLQHHPHAAAAKTDANGNLPLHLAAIYHAPCASWWPVVLTSDIFARVLARLV